MDKHSRTDSPGEPFDTEAAAGAAATLEETSTEYLGRWNGLISTTNWEKGRIICEWREAMIDSAAPSGSYGDEAWSRRVGNVSPQHVGRLRRVYQRFGSSYTGYAGLYWSHFQAALEWPDAEMWLEGAVQNGWSVSQMRNQRWQAIGAPPDQAPREEDVVTAEWDEDVNPDDDIDPDYDGVPAPLGSGVLSDVQDAPSAAVDASEAVPRKTDEGALLRSAGVPADEATAEPFRPFEHLGSLPPDVDEAFEAFKLAILQHKLSGWQEISLDDVLAVLDALKQLACAPADD
ncbi:MAG: hypothetical protein A2V70_00815 [Planctomycetes bacterium RBG_13_63_9]|nr:MAG: hypothetical protein A2V70_00815 [Planctomycetes bacterium RBG_13_63_9]